MAWTAEKVRALRESNPSETAKKDGESGKWTAERVRALRTSTPSQPADAAALRAQKQTEAANADLTSKAFDEYRANNNLGFADEADRQSDWLRGESSQALRVSSPEGRAIGGTALLEEQSPTGRESAGFAVRPGSRVEALSAAAKYGVPMSTNVLEQVGSGAAAYGDGLAQKLKASYAPYSQKDEFDRLNEWFDQPRNQELVGKLLEQKSGFTTYAEQGTSRNAASAGDGSIDPFRTAAGKSQSGAKYTDDDLRKQGYSAAEIAQARDYLTRYDAIPEWKKQARRAGNTIGGIADSVAGGAVMTGETAVQSAKNIAATQQNWARVRQEIKGDARAERLFQLLTDVDMDYNPVYPESRNRDLVLMGYGSEEIRNMRDRLAGLEANDSVDPETSVGYQLYKRGQDLTGAAQSGLSDGSRAVQGAVSSAAENLAVAAINPAAVLPVLSLQGAGDAMGQSIEKGKSAGKTLAGGALKFGAGWAINSVGAADLAKTMGSDYAKDTVAGQIADWVRGMAGSSDFAQQYPAIANAVTGGMDNAMQAFVETYADTAIDAALGDADAAKDLFTKEHLLNALESGLSGGASGALGGAVGTALARYNDGDASWRGNAEYYDQLDRYEKAGAAEKARQQRVEEPGTALSALRPADTGASRSSPEVGALLQGSPAGEGALDGRADSATKGSVQEQTAVNDDPAVHTWQDSATDGGSAETAVISDNLAVQTFAEAEASDSLTGKTIKLFTPEAGNEANRAAFTEVYGVELPDTAAATRRVLREVAAQRGRQNAVENAGERAETPSVTFGDSSLREGALEERAGTAAEGSEYADLDLKVDPADHADEGSTTLRETYGLKEPDRQTARQSEVQRQLEQWGVESGKTKAAQDISQKLPANVDADRYAAAASTIYHLAQMDEVKSFDDALRLAGAMDNTALNVNYILDSGEGGRIALNTAYLYGADTKEQAGGYGGGLTDQSASGQGRVYYEGTLDHDGTDMGSRIIELNAAATGTDAVLKNVLQNNPNVRAYVDSETARIFFGDNVSDIFGTVLHEDYHWYNSLDQAGAKSLQDHALTYLAQMDGYESVDEMIRDKMDVYASQKLTYEQAAEELVADAWRGIFATEADFKRWVEFQRGQAEKNAGVRGSIHKVMNRVKNLLSDIISRAKEVLTIDPGNAAALKAKRLAEAQRRTLQDEYFAHAEKAMDTLRAAKENAAALKTESAAEGRNIRFSIQRGADGESYVKIDEDILEGVPKEKWRTTVKQALRERFPNGFERDGWKILNEERGQKEFLWSKEAQNLWSKKKGIFADKMRMAANLDEIIQTANKVYRETPTHEHKGIEAFNRGKIEIQVGPNFYDADVVTAIKPDGREIFYDIVNIEKQKNRTPHDTYLKSNDDRGSLWESSMELSGGTHVESEDSRSRLPKGSIETSGKAHMESEDSGSSGSEVSEQSIAQNSAESKRTDEPVKKSVRFQMAEQAERDAKRNRQRQASRAIADNSAAIQTLVEIMGLTRGVRVSDDSILGVAERLVKASGAKGKADTERVAREMRTLIEYMKTEGADMNKAQGLAETIAGEILDSATYRNTELWQQYPEYHELSYTVDKNGKAKAELVRQYGSWGEAVAEARRHGVKLRQEEGHRDGNPAEEYEAIVNDTRSMGGTKQGAAELFRGAAKAAGVDGAASMESTEWLDVLMNVHDAIKPRMMSRFADVAEYEDAKVELAGRMIGDLLHVNEMNDAQAIFDSFQKWQRRAAAAAAGDETSAAKAVKDLRAVQKEQTREFNRRLAENQKAGNQSEAVQQMQEQQRRNAKAEAMLDANLDALGVDITNSGDMAEKLDVLKEAYEREWRAEKKRLKEERQQMLDEIMLENKTLKAENRDLARQVANEQRRADRAEYSQIVQEREIMEWEAENQKKAEAWQQKQAQKNAIAVEVARQQRDEDIAVAKALAEKRVQRARDGRKADELKRSIRNNAAQLNQMILRPSKGKYVQKDFIHLAVEVAKMADMTILNDKAVARLEDLHGSIKDMMGTKEDPSSIGYDWDKTGVPDLIQTLRDELRKSKKNKLNLLKQQLTEAEALGDGEKAERLRDRLKARIRETENRTYLPMTVEQLRMLKAITAGTLHVIRTENKTLSLAKTEEIDAFAQKAGLEVLAAKGNEAGRLRDLATKYNLDMLGAKRVFRMLGGYAKNSQMERLADMLNQGQLRQTEIIVEGTRLFDNVTGKTNLKQMERFAGPGAELVDIGLKDTKGKAVPLTHGQLCSLYMHLQNADSREHLLNGGLTLPDTTLYNKGDIERAYQKGQTVKIGMLTGADGMPMADTILNTVENALTDYDRKWIEDMKGFFGNYTTNLINETSMKLVGFQRATVKNYYPIAVAEAQLASEIEGVKMDATIEGRGFLKERVKSGLPILLEECSSVVQRSLRDTAAYAGLAAPIRDANRILNADVETRDGIEKLKNGILKEHWGQDAVNYVDYLLTDLQTKRRKRSDGIGRAMGKLRGNYAGAILTLNPGVAIAQAASLPTAGAVLGSDTMAAVLPFVKNLSGKQLAALEAEIREHGDALLQYRLRGSQRGELASIGVSGSFAEKAMDKLPKSVTGWINKMDEITVVALWEGAKHYVEHHTEKFADGAATKGSDAYWKAVNQMYQKVIEETQPNYTVMQRAGIQRSDNEITKTLTMFTTQRFQNYGILADAVMDYNAQRTRYNAEKSAENKAEVQRAGQSLRRAAASQVVQTAVFALMKIGADFLLHRWDREQDENGDITAWSFLKRYTDLFLESAASNPMFGSELYGLTSNLVSGTVYDVVSASNLTAINNLSEDAVRFYQLLRKDTSEMNEKELAAYHEKLRTYATTLVEDGMQVQGIPAGNAGKLMTAAWKWGENIVYAATKGEHGEQLSFHSTPSSATGQYDRLFNAIERGDAEEAAAALGKLEQMGKSDKVKAELKKRLKNHDPDIETAAKARNAGNDRTRQNATIHCIRELYAGLGIREGVKEDAAKREAIIDLVTGAVNQKADELLAGDKDRNVYDDLTDALEVGRAKDVQSEVDRLLTAGKKADAIQKKITGVVKSEYLAGNSYDREKLAAMLLRLEADGKPLYEEKDFESWVEQDKKKQEAAAEAVDEWAEVR